MKKLFFITLLIGGFAVATQAQSTPSITSDTARGVKKNLRAELNLTKDQAQQMKQLRADFKPKVDAIKSDASLSQAQKREQMKNLAKERRDKLNTILTPEQQQKLKQSGKMGYYRRHKTNSAPVTAK